MTPGTTYQFDPTTQKNIQSWLSDDYDQETKDTIRNLLSNTPESLVDAFYTHLSFGTGGMRGLMGIGSNRMNIYTIRAATQGLANYILQQPLPKEKKQHSVMIGYDSRNNSEAFAEETAKVLAANGIEVHIFHNLHPTPLVSFGCRLRKCTAAVMITASHNPPAYNGYKVFWSDGAQVLPPQDGEIIQEVNKIESPKQVKSVDSLDHPLICQEGADIDAAYMAAISVLQNYPIENHSKGQSLSIVYTPLHGTGVHLVPQALSLWGFDQVHLVKEQALPNGFFPTVASPNPEDPSALQMGINELQKLNADLLLATDPDTDRVGVGVLHDNSVRLLTGNQIACLCLYHILEALVAQKRLPPRAATIKTLTTTQLFSEISNSFHVPCFEVLSGFKYIAGKIHEWEQDKINGYTFLFGGEDSYGYLVGTLARDKDAVICCALIAEVALKAKLKGKTLVDQLEFIYDKYGSYTEKLLSINYPDTKEGRFKMQSAMQSLRDRPPHLLDEHAVIAIEDYKSGRKTFLKEGEEKSLQLPSSDVLVFRLENDGSVIARQSGTEPKIKFYAALKNSSVEKIDRLLLAIKTRAAF